MHQSAHCTINHQSYLLRVRVKQNLGVNVLDIMQKPRLAQGICEVSLSTNSSLLHNQRPFASLSLF
jgi:hypothetical protein